VLGYVEGWKVDPEGSTTTRKDASQPLTQPWFGRQPLLKGGSDVREIERAAFSQHQDGPHLGLGSA
jgi:hypothetical protein